MPMKKVKIISLLAVLFITLFSFNAFAMEKEYIKDPERPSPNNEIIHEDRSLNYEWTWLNDKACVRFRSGLDRAGIERQYSLGIIETWAHKENGIYQKKTRDSYSGKWSQNAEGNWSFEFDDKTIPVGVTKIDGVLYAFTGFGELKAEYEYYTGFKTEADGIVKANSAEFNQWLATQYLPDCTSH